MASKEVVEERILKAVSETIENFAFEEVILDKLISELPGDLPEMLCGMISVGDPPIGEIGLLVPKRLMAKFTESIHCIPAEELGMPNIMDNLGEMLNTLAGRLIANSLPGDRTFMLGIPSTGIGIFPPSTTFPKLLKFLVGEDFLVLSIPEKYWSL